jgi:hypothetical protein
MRQDQLSVLRPYLKAKTVKKEGVELRGIVYLLLFLAVPVGWLWWVGQSGRSAPSIYVPVIGTPTAPAAASPSAFYDPLSSIRVQPYKQTEGFTFVATPSPTFTITPTIEVTPTYAPPAATPTPRPCVYCLPSKGASSPPVYAPSHGGNTDTNSVVADPDGLPDFILIPLPTYVDPGVAGWSVNPYPTMTPTRTIGDWR